MQRREIRHFPRLRRPESALQPISLREPYLLRLLKEFLSVFVLRQIMEIIMFFEVFFKLRGPLRVHPFEKVDFHVPGGLSGAEDIRDEGVQGRPVDLGVGIHAEGAGVVEFEEVFGLLFAHLLANLFLKDHPFKAVFTGRFRARERHESLIQDLELSVFLPNQVIHEPSLNNPLRLPPLIERKRLRHSKLIFFPALLFVEPLRRGRPSPLIDIDHLQDISLYLCVFTFVDLARIVHPQLWLLLQLIGIGQVFDVIIHLLHHELFPEEFRDAAPSGEILQNVEPFDPGAVSDADPVHDGLDWLFLILGDSRKTILQKLNRQTLPP